MREDDLEWKASLDEDLDEDTDDDEDEDEWECMGGAHYFGTVRARG